MKINLLVLFGGLLFLNGCSFIIGRHLYPDNSGYCLPCVDFANKFGIGIYFPMRNGKFPVSLGYVYEE